MYLEESDLDPHALRGLREARGINFTAFMAAVRVGVHAVHFRVWLSN
jgi:hypothetical protein